MKNYNKILSLRGVREADDAAISANKQSPNSGVRARLPRRFWLLAMTTLLWVAPAFAASTTKICCYVPSPPEQGLCITDNCYDCLYSEYVQMGASWKDAQDICDQTCADYYPNMLCTQFDGYNFTECGTCTVGGICNCVGDGSGTIEPREGPNCLSGETRVTCSNISTATNLGTGTITCQETGPSPREIAVAACKNNLGSISFTLDDCFGGTLYCGFTVGGYDAYIDVPISSGNCYDGNLYECRSYISMDSSLCDTMHQ